MNHIYRSIWNEKTGTFVAISENAKNKGKSASSGAGVVGAGFALKALAVSLSMAFGSSVYALPVDGVVTAGIATITSGTSGGNMTVNQRSQNVALNWQSFNIAKGEALTFVQPNSSAVALNRVWGADPSSILGNLSANGKVFLVNPNGILFGRGASVNVGGLVASTLNLSDSDFMAGRYKFAGAGTGAILNQGSINADGGYVALLGANVSNQGTINARLGTVALAAGNAITLDVAGDGFINVTVDRGALKALVDNGGMIEADGGHVLLSAQAAGDLLHTVVNNSGIIQARTIDDHNGTIRLLGDMQSGTVSVGGKLDASAPNGGNGGFIDTSAAQVKIAGDINVTTNAVHGLTGSWLIDPADYTIAATGGDITGAQLSANLAGTNITVRSISGGAGSSGDINVNDTVSWSANKLTLNAQNNININTLMNASGTASLAFEYGQGAAAAGNTSVVNVRAAINLPAGENFSSKQGIDGTLTNYTVITSLGAAGSVTATDLQGINGNLGANYVLGSNIDASATSEWNAGAGFVPLTTYQTVTVPDCGFMCFPQTVTTPFTGRFDGLGHIISNFSIARKSESNVGLFGTVQSGASVQNVGLVGGSVAGSYSVGALAGTNSGAISNAYFTGTLEATAYAGGLVGSNRGGGATVNNSFTTGGVTGGFFTGGLVGYNADGAVISNSYTTGNVTLGGLVGANAATIINSYASGQASNAGLVEANSASGTIINSYWNSSLNSVGVGSGTNSAGAIGLTATQMKNTSSFAGFDFNGTWVNYDTYTTPLLRSFMPALTVTANNAAKTYDGGTYSGGNGVTYSTAPNMSNVLGTASYSGTSQGAINAGSYAITASGLYSNQQGYIISYASGTLAVNKANLTMNTTDVSKTYDGSLTASGTATVTSGTLFSNASNNGVQDSISGGTFAFANANAGTGNKTVSTTGVTVADGNNGDNYNITYVDNTTSTIAAKALSATASAANKIYDGTTTAAATLTLNGLVGGETLSATGAATFNSKDVANANLVTVNSTSLADGRNGGLASNYSLAGGQTAAATIAAKALTATATASNKTYDGHTTAAATLTLNGLVGSETLSATGAATFNSKDVANANLVTVNGTALEDGTNGGLASNYSLSGGQTAVATIAAKALTISGMKATNKVYDGNAIATLEGGTLNGLIDAETLDLTGQAGTFADKNVGKAKTVTVTGTALADGTGLASNYAIANPTGLAADITRLTTVAWVGGTSGSWFDAANWAGGAVPDLANVANVVIPAGITVTVDNGSVVSPAQAGNVDVESIGTGGSLSVVAGSLSVATSVQLASIEQSGGTFSSGAIEVGSFSQSGGSLASTGNLAVTKAYSQSGSSASVNVGGNTDITQTSGATMLGNITTAGTLGVTAVHGNITQLAGTSIASTGAATLSAPNGNVALAGSGNSLGAVIISDSNSLATSSGGANDARLQNALAGASAMAGMSATRGIAGASSSAAGQSSRRLPPGNSAAGILAGLNVTLEGQGVKLPPEVQPDGDNDGEKR